MAEQYNVENSPEKSDSDDLFASVPPSPKPSNSRSLIPNCIPSSQPREVINISSDDESILAIKTAIPSGNREYTKIGQTASSESENDSNNTDSFLDIDELLSQHLQRSPPSPLPIGPSSSRPVRERKPTSKMQSQERRNIEKQEKRKAKLLKKPKKADTSQINGFELPFRSSQ